METIDLCRKNKVVGCEQLFEFEYFVSISIEYIRRLLLERYSERTELNTFLSKLYTINHLIAKDIVDYNSVLKTIEELNYIGFILFDEKIDEKICIYLHFLVVDCRDYLETLCEDHNSNKLEAIDF